MNLAHIVNIELNIESRQILWLVNILRKNFLSKQNIIIIILCDFRLWKCSWFEEWRCKKLWVKCIKSPSNIPFSDKFPNYNLLLEIDVFPLTTILWKNLFNLCSDLSAYHKNISVEVIYCSNVMIWTIWCCKRWRTTLHYIVYPSGAQLSGISLNETSHTPHNKWVKVSLWITSAM